MTIDEYDGWIWSNRGPGICGCGAPQQVLELLYGYLLALKNRDGIGKARDWLVEETGGPDKNTNDETTLQWLFYYWCHNMGLTEHGGTVRFSWLTKHGEDVLAAMEEWGVDLEKIEELTRDLEECNPPKWVYND